MVRKEIISSIISNLALKSHHISNDEIRVKVSGMSLDERKSLLSDKLNPFEKEEYEHSLNMLEFFNMNDNPNDFVKQHIKETEETLFNYDKRIIRGYDLDKYKNNVLKYNLDDFQSEDTDKEMIRYDETSSTGAWELEYNQMLKQSKQEMSTGQVGALRGYFSNDYKYINGDLDPRYNQSAWNQLSESEKKAHHESNLKSMRELDKVIDESNGLVTATVLLHGTQDTHIVDAHTRIGEKLNLKGYISTSFIEHVGKSYTENDAFLVKFLAPTGTKGVCANDLNNELTNYSNEHEYLLGKGNKGTVVDIDYDNRVFTVLLE